MTTDSLGRALNIVREAVYLEGDERETFLDEACGDDAALRAEVDELLAEDDDGAKALSESKIGERRRDLDQLADASGLDASDSLGSGSVAAGLARDPEQIGDFRVLRRIARGGMGLVYEAAQETPRRHVAVKVLQAATMTPKHLARFQHEAQVLGHLVHPGIAQIHEVGTFDQGDGPQPFFAMEFVEGVDLVTWSRAAGRTLEDRLAVFNRVCAAVNYAHQKGVIHRDLKPDNVLVTADGDPKVLDFGVARATDGDMLLTSMHTEVGQLVGTVAYMSPEQAAGDATELDIRSDVYTLGVLLFQMLADRLPYAIDGRSIPNAVQIIREDEPTGLGSVDTTLRGDLETIVKRALEKEPERRYASALELSADVERFLTHEPILARPPSTFYQVRKFARRHRGLSAGLSIALIALTVGLVIAVRFGLGEARERERSERAAYRSALAGAAEVVEERPTRAGQLLAEAPEHLRGWEYDYFSSILERHAWELPGEASDEYYAVEVLFAPTGSSVLTFSDKHTLLCVATDTGRTLWGAVHEDGWVTSVLAVSARSVVAVTRGNELRVLDLATGELREQQALEHYAIELAWNAAGDSLFLRAHDRLAGQSGAADFYFGPPGDLRLADELPTEALRSLASVVPMAKGPDVLGDTQTGEWLDLAALGWPQASVIANTAQAGRYLASGPTHLSAIEVDVNSNSIRLERDYPFPSVKGLALSSDETQAAAVSIDRAILLDAATGQSLAVFPVTAASAARCDLDPSARWLAVRDDTGLRVWDLLEERQVLRAHSSYVYRVEFTPDSRTLISRDWLCEVRLWDAVDGRPLGTVSPLPNGRHEWFAGETEPLAVSQDGSQLLSSSTADPQDPRAVVADLAVDSSFRPVEVPGNAPVHWKDLRVQDWLHSDMRSTRRVEFSPDGSLLFSWHRVYDTRTQRVAFEMPPTGVTEGEDRSTGEFSPSGRFLAVAASDGVRVLAVGSWEEIARPYLQLAHSAAWSPDGSRLAVGTQDGLVLVYETDTFALVATLAGHETYVHDVAWSPDGTRLATASGDKTVRLWDSVPAHVRHAEALAEEALRKEMRPRVQAMLEREDAYAVATALRGDAELDDERRHAALRVLRELVVE